MTGVDYILKAKDAAYDLAQIEALSALHEALSPGRQVRWRHGEQTRFGEVIEVLGFQYKDASVRIRSVTTGKIIWVDARRIVAEL